MATQYVTVSTQDLGSGIDTQSSEDQIKEGFSQDILNCVIRNNYLSKRKGYQLFAGGIPLRVLSVTATGTDLALTFDTAVSINSELDLTNVRASPILIYGKMSATSEGDFPSSQNSIHYYTDFRSNPRKTFDTTATPVYVASTEISVVTPYVFVGTSQSLSLVGNSNDQFIANGVSVDKATFDITIQHNNQTGQAFTGFVYVNQKPIVTGSSYVAALNTSVDSTFSIPALTHNLVNFNIMARMYIDTGTAYTEIIPDALSILPDGTVTGTLINQSGTDFDFIVLLSATPTAQTLRGTASAQSTVSVSLPEMTTDFVFMDCYLEDLGTGVLTKVIPNSITIDAETKTALVQFNNNSSTGTNFKLFYEYATLKTNKLTVQMTTSITGVKVDTNPQLTVWGIDQEEIYPGASVAGRAGWVTHIDSYRRASDARVICGLGWSFFASYNRDEYRPDPEGTPEEISSTFLLPSVYPNMSERILNTQDVGPAFAGNSSVYTRTRGYYKFDGGEEGWAKGTKVEWDASVSLVKYTCTLENFSIVAGTGNIISTDLVLGDYVTVNQSPFKIHDGTFKVVSTDITSSGTAAELCIWISNAAVDSSDFDGIDCGMDIGVFTDVLEFTGDFCPFLVNDMLYSEDIDPGYVLTVLAATTTGVRALALCSGFTSPLSISAGLRLFGQRKSSVIPLRTLTGTPSAFNFVLNDSVQITGFPQLTKVKSVIPTNTLTFSMSESVSGVATVTLGSSPNWTKPGILLPLQEIGELSNVYEIVELISANEFTVNVQNTIVRNGRIPPHFIQVDEALLIRDDQRSTIKVEVPTRWIPIESPEDEYTATPLTMVKTLSGSFTDQPFVRSAMAADNMYLTNGVDPVLKFDGRDMYHAGIPRWHAGLFSTIVPGSGIAVDAVTAAFTSVMAGNKFVLATASDAAKFTKLDIIGFGTSESFTVSAIDTVLGTVSVTSTIPGGTTTGTLSLQYVYKYYFRLEYTDANGSTIPGAATQSDDFGMLLASTSTVNLRCVGLPQFGPRDYDRMILRIFRTTRTGTAPFYEVGTVPVEYNNGNTYIDFQDTVSDSNLTSANLDAQSISIARAELPVAITLPQRALYLTSTDNRVILANILSYPEMSVQIDKSPNVLAADLNGKLISITRPSTGAAAKFTFVTDAVTPLTITSVAATSGVATIAHSGGDLGAGTWVYIFSTTVYGLSTLFMGWHQIATSAAGSFTFATIMENVSAVAPGTTFSGKVISSATSVPVWLGTDANYSSHSTVLVGSNYRGIAMARLANAINAHQRQQGVDAWLTAASGQSYAAGQLVLNSCKPEEGIVFSVSSLGSILWFVDGVRQTSTDMISYATARPSRILVSYQNKPEVFDSPNVSDARDSDSIIDVNPSDGQEITGILPFFGDAAYGAAQKSAILAVFKSNSIYVIDLNAKAAGANPVQKIDSQGIGCKAPYSLAHTRDGIMFANEGGIYRLNHDLTVEFVGQYLERMYGQMVNISKLSIMQGHNYSQDRHYHLSFPSSSSVKNSDIFAYDQSREQSLHDRKAGAWTRFDSFPATGWANLGNDAYFASSRGKVYSLRNTATPSDYRDDEQAISMKVDFRGMDFGDAGIRKTFPHLLLRFRNGSDNLGTFVYTATNLSANFVATDKFMLDKNEINALGDLTSQQVYPIRFSIYDNKGMFLQVRVVNALKDEHCDVTQLSVKVAGLKLQGTVEARATTKSTK